MASVVKHTSSFLEKAGEDLTCSVCLEVFIPPWVPKILDCVHVVCQLCLGNMVDGGRESVCCPECREVTHIPTDGVKALKTNLKVQSLAENYQKYGTLKGESLSQACTKHDGEIKNLVCVQCKTFICSFCYEEGHQSHKFKPIKTFQKQLKKMEEEITTNLDGEVRNLEEYTAHLSKLEERVVEALEIEKTNLHAHVESIIDTVQKKERAMVDELQQSTKTENIEEITSEKMRVESLLTRLNTIREHSTDSLDSLMDESIFEQEMHIAQMKSLLDEDMQAHIQPDLTIAQFHPQVPPIEISLGEFKKIGKFQFLTKFGELRDPRSIAVSSVGLIVVLGWEVTNGCLRIFEFSRGDNNYLLKETLKLPQDESNPVDLAIALMDKYLVACGTCIDIFSSSGQYEDSFYTKKIDLKLLHQLRSITKRLSKKPQTFRGPKPKNSSVAHSLAITNDGKVIVGNCKESTLTIFSSDSKDAIRIPVQPWRLATNETQVVMSDSENNLLCAVDIETEKVLFNVSVKSPQGLCYTTSDIILVTVGTKHGSVEQFCGKTGRWLCQVVSGLAWPLDICSVSDDKVAVLEKLTVSVFHII